MIRRREKKNNRNTCSLLPWSGSALFFVNCVGGVPANRMVWCGSLEQESRDPCTVADHPGGRNAGSRCDDPPPGYHLWLWSCSFCPPSRSVLCFPALGCHLQAVANPWWVEMTCHFPFGLSCPLPVFWRWWCPCSSVLMLLPCLGGASDAPKCKYLEKIERKQRLVKCSNSHALLSMMVLVDFMYTHIAVSMKLHWQLIVKVITSHGRSRIRGAEGAHLPKLHCKWVFTPSHIIISECWITLQYHPLNTYRHILASHHGHNGWHPANNPRHRPLSPGYHIDSVMDVDPHSKC